MRYESVVSDVNDIIAGYQMDLTIRQVYYRFVAAGLIPNTRSSYNSVDSQLVKAMEREDIDGDRIADRSRRIDDVSFDSPEHFLAVCFWNSQPVYCDVWTVMRWPA